MPTEPQQTDIVSEARAKLAKATRGPLTLIRYEHGGGRLIKEPYSLVADFYQEGDREFYDSAPELLRQLCDEVERQRTALIKLRDSTSDMWACSFAGEVLKGKSVDDALSHAMRYDNA